MGFPDDYPIVVSDTQAYRQFGNAVCPLVVEAVGKEVLEVVATHLHNKDVMPVVSGINNKIRRVLMLSPIGDRALLDALSAGCALVKFLYVQWNNS